MTTTTPIDTAMEDFENNFKQYVHDEAENEVEAHAPTNPALFAETEAETETDSFTDTISSVYGVTVPTGMMDVPVTVHSLDDWSDEAKVFIPSIDSTYFWQPYVKDLIDYHTGVNMGDNVYMYGDPAVGKSSFVEQVCARTNQPFVRMNGIRDIDSSSIFGAMGLADGETVWTDGTLAQAAKFGAVFLQDEVTSIPAEILMGYQWLLENGGKILLSDKQGTNEDKVITPDPRFRFICCDNTNGQGDMTGDYAGTGVVNSAFIDRFQTFIKREFMKQPEEVQVLMSRVPELTNELASKMVQVAGLIRTSKRQGELSVNMSMRTLESWGKKACYTKDTASTMRVAYFNKLGEDDERAVVSGMYSTVFGGEL